MPLTKKFASFSLIQGTLVSVYHKDIQVYYLTNPS